MHDQSEIKDQLQFTLTAKNINNSIFSIYFNFLLTFYFILILHFTSTFYGCSGQPYLAHLYKR